MARPKKSDKAKMATFKIENAFWKLLETESYSDITVLRICQESGINRNSFYYHYKDINDLAYTAFKSNASSDASEALLSALFSQAWGNGERSMSSIDPSILHHAKKIMLCASSDSLFLNQLVRDLLKQSWFDALGIDEKLLNIIDELQIDFIFSGMSAVLGRAEISSSPFLMAELSRTEIGQSAFAVMKTISDRQKSRT